MLATSVRDLVRGDVFLSDSDEVAGERAFETYERRLRWKRVDVSGAFFVSIAGDTHQGRP